MTSSRIESCFDFSGSDGNEAEAASRSNNWSECWKDFFFLRKSFSLFLNQNFLTLLL
jgi:hypothetical protein